MGRDLDDEHPSLERLISLGATDLTARAEGGNLSRAYGREAEIEQVLKSLMARRSAILVGPAEVGKTAVLHEVISRIVWRQAPESLHGMRVISISTGIIMAGTKYMGEWETRLRNLLEGVKQDQKLVLAIEDIWTLRDAGRASDEADGFATFIRPYLERQDVVLLGETTAENFASTAQRPRGLADDYALMKYVSAIPVEETSLEATKVILSAVARRLQRSGKVRIEASALERALELTRRFQPYQAFPGKAIRLLEETARPQGIEHHPADGSPAAGAVVVITADMITSTCSRITDLPEKIISDSIPLSQEEIRAYFEERVIGQPDAVSTIIDVVTLVKAELHDTNRPLGVYFFVGPTGVGKTELAKTLAEYLFGSKDKLIRFDMSEYQTPLSLHSLLEQLTEKQRRQTFSVLLLDEIEKAGSFIFDLFLQVFDDARLTGPSGRSVDLHNTIIIMTSNLGSNLVEDRPTHSIGFVPSTNESTDHSGDHQHRLIRTVEDYFRPEFVNRLDGIVTFQPLGIAEMRQIARRELNKALEREGVRRRNILLDFRDEVLDVLLTAGFSPMYGARPLQRAIKKLVLLPLARQIAAQPSAGEQMLELCARDGQIQAEVIPLSPQTEMLRPEDGGASVPDRQAPREASAGPVRGKELRQLEDAAQHLREQVEGHIGSDHYQAMQSHARRLLAETGQPTFWDDREQAQRTLTTIARLEHVTDRFPELLRRSEGLAEAVRMARVHGDVGRVRQLAAALEALERDVALSALELLAGDNETAGAGAAFVCITPIVMPKAGEANGWAVTLADMYMGWARRKGYDVECIHEDDADPILVIRGPNLGHILRGEEGIHKLSRETGKPKVRGRAAAEVLLARVEVLAVPVLEHGRLPADGETIQLVVLAERQSRDGKAGLRKLVEVNEVVSGVKVRVQGEDAEHLAIALLAARATRPSKGAPLDGGDAITRIYHQARTQYVRDPRTGAKETHARDVLAGGIDGFLLSFLRQNLTADDRERVAHNGISGGENATENAPAHFDDE